jgi:hypothetical protein
MLEGKQFCDPPANTKEGQGIQMGKNHVAKTTMRMYRFKQAWIQHDEFSGKIARQRQAKHAK